MHTKPVPEILLLACFMSMVGSTPLNSSDRTQRGNNTVNMFYLGTINEKSYYTEASTKNWPNARDFCINSGMHLASITTIQQAAFLQSVHNCTNGPSYFCQLHWIGGRTVISNISQFEWDHNNQTVTNPGLPFEAPETSSVCLAYEANETGGKFITAACTTNYRQLCETIQGS